jgi:hypothetical protein
MVGLPRRDGGQDLRGRDRPQRQCARFRPRPFVRLAVAFTRLRRLRRARRQRGRPFGARAGQRPDAQQSHPRGTVDRPVTVPETEGRLLTASRLLSPHGTEMRARTPSRARSTRSPSRARALSAIAIPAHAMLADAQTLGESGEKRQRPRRSLSGAAVKRCGVAFPRPRMNGSEGRFEPATRRLTAGCSTTELPKGPGAVKRETERECEGDRRRNGRRNGGRGGVAAVSGTR